jgi:hypothetical protein
MVWYIALASHWLIEGRGGKLTTLGLFSGVSHILFRVSFYLFADSQWSFFARDARSH